MLGDYPDIDQLSAVETKSDGKLDPESPATTEQTSSKDSSSSQITAIENNVQNITVSD